MARAVKPTKKITDRRRSGIGDNVAFTAHGGAGGLGTGKRTTTVASRNLTPHQFTNRVARNAKNGRGKKTL